jgi:ferrous iron transport protein B
MKDHEETASPSEDLSPRPPSPVHRSPSTVHRPPSTAVIALVGNPNTGKTTLFNALAGMRQRIGNYPGVTVETKKGRLVYRGRSFELVDLPGTYSLAPRSPDEMVAVDLILGQQPGEPKPDVVVSIVDASNLERNLYLTTQVLELGVPVVIALNMTDIAARHGIAIDVPRLANQLGVRVVALQANKGKGLDQLKQAIAEAAAEAQPPRASPPFPEAFESETTTFGKLLGGVVPPFLVRRLLLDVGGYTESRLGSQHAELRTSVQTARQRLAAASCKVPEVEARARYTWIRQVTAGCLRRPEKRPVTWTDRIDRVLTHKVWGSLIFLALMFLVFQSIFTWAKPLMDLIDKGREVSGDWVQAGLAPGPLRSLMVDGVFKGVGSVLVFLPQILILFGFIAVLEDCGYMARAAFLMDKVMARCGLSGKSFIPMLSSVACAVPGIMATRVIENRRDRLTTILVAPLMSCSARLPVYILLIGAFLTAGFGWWVPGLVMFSMYALGLVVAPLVAFLLKRTLLRGETPVFVMEMPLYKWPSVRTVLRRMTDSAWAFLRRAGTLILASMILVWALLYFPYTNDQGQSYDLLIADQKAGIEEQSQELKKLTEEKEEQGEQAPEEEQEALQARIERLESEVNPVQKEIFRLRAEWTGRSLLGRVGHQLEPIFTPLGWDWRIGMAALASFPAREVVIGTLGIIYQTEADADTIRKAKQPGETELAQALQAATWDDESKGKVFTVPVALSLMVFFALCCQCASTLAVIRRETRSWGWPLFTFVYMTVLAYLGALIVYQVGTWIA